MNNKFKSSACPGLNLKVSLTFEFFSFQNINEYEKRKPQLKNIKLKEVIYTYVIIHDKQFLLEENGTFSFSTRNSILSHLQNQNQFGWTGHMSIKEVKKTSGYIDFENKLINEYPAYPKIEKKKYEPMFEVSVPDMTPGRFMAYAIINDTECIGYIDTMKYTNDFIVEMIEISPEYYNKKLCRPFFTFLLRKLKLLSSGESVKLSNCSDFPLRACMCYLRAGLDAGYRVLDGNDETLNERDCAKPDTPPPTTMIFVAIDDR